MATTHKPFRELVKPGSNFEFVGRTRVWIVISVILVSLSVAMLFVNNAWRGDYLNWTIDFKGGTEIIFSFSDKESGKTTTISDKAVREGLQAGGFDNFEVSSFSWSDDAGKAVKGMLIRTPSFGAVKGAKGQQILTDLREKFKDREILTARWSGDRIYVRSMKPFNQEECSAFLAPYDLQMKPWSAELAADFAAPDEGTLEYSTQMPVFGLERQFQKVLQEKLGVTVNFIQSHAVGARAGKELRNDGIKSLFYAMALIMLYLAFRFDIRYAPGAVVALLHDALLVVGVFAVSWMDVSLTSVAALLTVIGYSVNDTVVIFDRIRENVGRLKDKKLARIINISLNETLARTLLTSLTLFVVTVAMFFFTTDLVRNFAFAMNIGVIVGVYSSVFVASPVLLYLDNKYYGGKVASGTSGVRQSSKKKTGVKKPSAKKSSAKKSTTKQSSDSKSSSDD